MHKRRDDLAALEDLLHRLNGADPGAAWAEFINGYSPLIMKVVSQFDYQRDRGNDCFLHVCEKLCERRFRRLQKFDPGGDARFQNWLATVVFNLCVDWHRSEFGRATLLPAISALPAFDQVVYRYCYEQGLSRNACLRSMEADFPGMTIDHLAASLKRIHAVLTPRQRWQLSLRLGRRRHESPDAWEGRIADPQPGPETSTQTGEEVERLDAALRRLSTNHRLLLHLRFQEGLTYAQIALAQQLGDTHRARRHVQAALDALKVALRALPAKNKRQV